MSRLIEEIVEITRWTGSIRPGRDWSTVERDIGTVLPDDYKELFSRFPSGAFCDAIVVANPVDARTDYPRFLREDVLGTLEILADERLEYLNGTNYRLFPAEGGLLPWGGDGQGGMFCWLTEPADPNRWLIAHYNADFREWFEYEGGVVEMIWEVLTRPGGDNLLRRDLDHEEPIFRVPSTYAGERLGWIPNPEYR
ncbi:hypothetical protein CU254_14470 [Amycolatopsis sp. AA4]|uniref:SMI1/KNR4 family protein n=1 Tax=Actinomycetes TaxID=1760 RepID=UPI0001B54535|nr:MULTISPECIES: SMI1/KNR4 family protein [Actinomycetes]ATY11526.1 hypothetical protein CU254_14470 [Amycolatopsis sp. AA4]